METIQKHGKGVVRMSIPAKIAYNGDAFKKSIFSLLDEIGCPKCFSGVDCHISTLRDYIYEAKGERLIPAEKDFASISKAAGINTDGRPQPMPFSMKNNNNLTVTTKPKLTQTIKQVDSIIDSVFEEIGCMACCSGHDILFRNFIDRIEIPRL
ncbi:hypothetical protein OOZ15_14770 [Galbibacter sp. EGI 63066]|uniref:hypothetical protein n=1 Tax=Galbibacter sp. EGI 63066 TaxID=2993559 RepID=UPI002248AF53|nr:hypothetical protein [Galbibacter sp. EGI 63066]MCX2681213.1 hypothetical protein [Galbibacter sp. EGI 63066]